MQSTDVGYSGGDTFCEMALRQWQIWIHNLAVAHSLSCSVCPQFQTPKPPSVQVSTLFDSSGIVVRFMNSNIEGNGIRDAASASALVQQVRGVGLRSICNLRP